MKSIEEQIEMLEQRATHLRSLLGFARRAFVIELAGTPKSGKSTSVEAVRHFFSRNGFRVHVLSERAAECPIPMKGHLFFNAWCLTSMLAELIENVETETDVIIIDRGIFDALVWLNAQHDRGEITFEEASTIEAFALLDRWTSLIDLAVVMNVDADEALSRERSQRIATGDGSIMNKDVLERIHQSVKMAIKKYKSHFQRVFEHEAVGGVKPSNIKLIDRILDSFDDFLDPNILVVARGKMLELEDVEAGGSFSPEVADKTVLHISKNAEFLKRSSVEGDDKYVQIIAAVALCYGNKIFKFDRKEKDPKKKLYGKSALWQGSHVRQHVGDSVSGLLLEAGKERVNEALFLGRNFELVPAGFAWVRSEPHFGYILRLAIENKHTAQDLRKKEFKKSRGFGLSGELLPWEDLKAAPGDYELESWSMAILSDYKGLLGLRDAV